MVVFLRLWYLQVVKAAELSDKAFSYGYGYVPKLAPRGLIEDRNGTLLAGVRSELVVTAIPEVLKHNPAVVTKLAYILGVSEDKLKQKLQNARAKPFFPSPIYAGVPIEIATRIAESGDDLPGIDVESQSIRYYPDDSDFAHILGYVWTPNQKDLDRLKTLKIKPQDYVGKVGLEAKYEQELMGTPGMEQVQLDAKKQPVAIVSTNQPVPGDKLTLSIDSDLQKLAMQQLNNVLANSPDSAGAAVAIDPKTGEVLCMASNPTYHANQFLQGIKTQDFETLKNDPLKPLYNRAIDGAYSPGSTFKLVSTLAAAKCGTFDPERVVVCNGYYEVGNRRSRCLGHHGPIRFEQALVKSCNTYFSDLAIRTGPDGLRNEAEAVGLGHRSGIDLPGEGKALVPTDDWLRTVQKLSKDQKPRWYPGDTVNLGIGQGELAVTPLQMADLACLIANKGFCYTPHLLKSVTAADGTQLPTDASDQPRWKVDEPDFIWPQLETAMVDVIEHGTARRARIPGITWAGKTGSTEHSGPDKKTHSWFVGYAPADNPRIAVAVLVEESGHGGEIAAPIAAAIVKRYMEEVGVLPKESSVALKVATASSAHLASFSSFKIR